MVLQSRHVHTDRTLAHAHSVSGLISTNTSIVCFARHGVCALCVVFVH